MRHFVFSEDDYCELSWIFSSLVDSALQSGLSIEGEIIKAEVSIINPVRLASLYRKIKRYNDPNTVDNVARKLESMSNVVDKKVV